MSNYEFEGYSDGDWEESWEIAWSEFDWESYLRNQDKSVQVYLSHYEKHLDRNDRIDEVAHQMGWDEQAWTNDDALTDNEPDIDGMETESDSEEQERELDPYTIHKHPIFIASKSLYVWLHKAWEQVAPACAARIPARTALSFQSSLYRGEQTALLSVHSLDMGDYSLAVCLFKRSLSELNTSLALLNEMDESKSPPLAYFKAQSRIRLFDLREIWLRVMRDCREELSRRFGDRER
jgi:hypothetical protein